MKNEKKSEKVDEKRTSKESSKLVAKAVKEINNLLDAVRLMKGHSFFFYEGFEESGFNKIVSTVCEKHKVNEKFVKNVGGWIVKRKIIGID